MSKLHQYGSLSREEQEQLFSNFLIDSWSYSKVSSFARNQKAFEMTSIYRMPFRESASTIAGSAYHEALKYYFLKKKEGQTMDIIELQNIAYEYIDSVKADKWKLQKTTPTIVDCQNKAIDIVNKLLINFYGEKSTYEDEIKQILDVELYCDEFVTVNGVDIPLPCHCKIDLIVETVSGVIAVVDHKSKTVFTEEEELKLSIGKQAITYVIAYETKTGMDVGEVWFVENKNSKNKDGSKQLNLFRVTIDKDSRRLYEALLYEPLKRMIEATSDPDYTYLINDSDNFVDMAEIYEFWSLTMMAEVDDFNIPHSKKELITKRLKKIRDVSVATVDPKVIKKFKENASEFIQYDFTNKNMNNQEKIEHSLRTLGIQVSVAHVFTGYSSNTYLINVNAGTNLASVMRFKLDIANALSVSSIRIMKDLFVYEGKSYLAVESPKNREESLYFDPKYLKGSKIPLGLDNFQNLVYWDVENQSTPHMLICGSTGSGKSVCIISILEYAKLYKFDEIVIFDPKYEFKGYSSGNIAVHNDIDEIELVMELMVEKMNDLVKNKTVRKTLIIFDEFADAVANSAKGAKLDIYKNQQYFGKNGKMKTERVKVGTRKSLEENLQIILQKGRSSGFRVVAATQRASVKVINGDSKVNFPVLICFRVPKEVDSKVVIDEAGAESLMGKGDGIIKTPELITTTRFQAFYVNK